jgi:arginine/ornithine N-succinyltransferase beta subunit
MASPLLPFIKVVAPYVAQIAAAAIPAFTSKPAEFAKIDPVIAKQIEELQAAATQNAESVHVLAENLQQAIQGIEAAAQDVKKQVATYRVMLLVALGLSGLSMLLSVYLLAK